MASTSAYIIFKAGDDEASTPVSLTPGGVALPSISSFSPDAGPVGTVVTITGDQFDVNTKVFFGDAEAVSWRVADNELGAIVPAGASTDKVMVKRTGSNFEFCASSAGISSHDFKVEDEYCESGALNQALGRIKYVGSNDFNNDLSSLSTCPMYSDFSGDSTNIGSAIKGSTKTFKLKLDSCGRGEMPKFFKMFIDWNRDGDFTDPGEFVTQNPSALNDDLYLATVSIPSNASVGVTRMRIVAAVYIGIGSMDDVSSCGNYPYGETQDYSLDIKSN